jgi:hypothetical protein
MSRWAALALLPFLLVAACKSQPPRDRFVPERLNVAGSYVHEGSGIEFPERAAGFERVAPTKYDREGRDVGIGYRRVFADAEFLFRAEVTLFVFPPPRSRSGRELSHEEQFGLEVQALMEGKQDVRELRRTTTTSMFRDQPVSVRAAEFEFVGGPALGGLPMRTLIGAFPSGDWRVKCRATIPPPRRAQTLAALEDLLRALGLPGTGLPAGAE